jgi:predicted phosphodiesterase
MTEPVNKLMCKLCGDVIESKTRHDFVRCKCKSIYVDGGKDYFKRGGDARNMIDLSVYADDVIK